MNITNYFSINNTIYKNIYLQSQQEDKSMPKFKGVTPIKQVATVSKESQDAIKNITENISKIQKFFTDLKEKFKTKPNKVVEAKQQYKGFVPTQGKSFTFKLGKWYMSVSQLKDHSDVLKIFTRRNDSSEPHLFLIEQNGQVYSNTNALRPRDFPKTKQYMSSTQISNSRVEEQIAVADREVSNFLECMEENPVIEHIDGTLETNLQSKMEEINKSLEQLDATTQSAKKNGWSQQSITYHKQKFPSYVYSETQGPSFHDGSFVVSIKKPREDENLIRLTVKNSYNDTLEVFYIENNSRVLSNVNFVRPCAIPKVYKYMTDEQIKKCGVEKYINFMEKELKSYNEFLNEHIGLKTPRKKRKNIK